MTIINLRGTSGSGKSTVVRRVMAAYQPGGIEYVHQDGRRQPLAQRLFQLPTAIVNHYNGSRPLFVPGHYETPCGGCDTIKTPDQVYELIRGAIAKGDDVIYEGIIVQDDTKRLLALHAEYPVNVIELATPIEDCLAGIQARRDARGDARPLDPKNTVERQNRVHKTCNKLRALGLNIPILGREEAYQACLDMLRVRVGKLDKPEGCGPSDSGSNPDPHTK